MGHCGFASTSNLQHPPAPVLDFAISLLLLLHLAFAIDLVCLATCHLMSSGLRVRLEELSKEADRLQVAAVELAEAIADLLMPGEFGDWVRVDDEFPPLSAQEFLALQTLQRYQGIEDGAPPLPEECLRIVARTLTCSPEVVLDRAKKAYSLGFWARISLETNSTFSEAIESESGVSFQHWVVLYRKTPSINRRLSSRACKDIAVTVEPDCICQGFETVSELVVFCAGAGVLVPPLEKWTSPW